MKKKRRNFTGQEKLAVLRRHLVDKVPVSDLCREEGIQPTQFYQWQKQLFENGTVAFERDGKRQNAASERIQALEAKLRRKDEVLAELMEEHVALKKLLGKSRGPMGHPGNARGGCGFCE